MVRSISVTRTPFCYESAGVSERFQDFFLGGETVPWPVPCSIVLLKTGGDINGDIFHEIEEAEEGSDEIIVDERWRITENGEATFTSLAVGGVDFSTLNSRVTTLWAARDNYLLKTGGELTGDLWLHTRGLNYGSKLWFGDKGSGDGYVYLHEDTDDHLTIHAADGSAPPRLCGLAIETTVPCAGPVGVFAFVTVTLPL